MSNEKTETKINAFERDMAEVLNKHGLDAYAGMPDYILAQYITNALGALKMAHKANEKHRGLI